MSEMRHKPNWSVRHPKMHVLASQIAGVRLQQGLSAEGSPLTSKFCLAVEHETTGSQLFKVRRTAQQSMLED